MDKWVSEERLLESMGHLLPEVRERAEVRAAFNEVLQTSELYRRVKSRVSESYGAAQRALSAGAAKLKGELVTMQQAVSAHCTLLEGESGRLAAQVEEERRRQEEGVAEEERRERRRREEEGRRAREQVRRETERREEERRREEARRQEEERQADEGLRLANLPMREIAFACEVAPLLAKVRRSGKPFVDPVFAPTGTRLLPPEMRSGRQVECRRAQ
jgi:hypothetical protein